MASGHQAIEVRVTGHVQGVGFRNWAAHEARQLGLTGWVCNDADGSVAALIVGTENAVAAMIERLRKGPRLASVLDVKLQSVEPDETLNDFRIV